MLRIIREMTLRNGDEDQTSLEAITKQLKLDLESRSALGDVNFIKKIIVPILHFERKVPIKFSLRDGDSINPIFVSDLRKADQEKSFKEEYFIDSNILDEKMKQNLKTKMVEIRQDKMPEVTKMMQSRWNRIYF